MAGSDQGEPVDAEVTATIRRTPCRLAAFVSSRMPSASIRQAAPSGRCTRRTRQQLPPDPRLPAGPPTWPHQLGPPQRRRCQAHRRREAAPSRGLSQRRSPRNGRLPPAARPAAGRFGPCLRARARAYAAPQTSRRPSPSTTAMPEGEHEPSLAASSLSLWRAASGSPLLSISHFLISLLYFSHCEGILTRTERLCPMATRASGVG
eukprot:scaffold26860_cov37-Tisochrysis_lutea.AAC.5